MVNEIEVTVEIDAPAERVWLVMIDVERWSEWTPSIISIRRLDAGPFGLGSQARVRQPQMAPTIWHVTEFVTGRGFVWESKILGVRTVGEHWVTQRQKNRSAVALKVRQTGPLVAIFHRWIGKLTTHYLEMEREGLKRRCEAAGEV